MAACPWRMPDCGMHAIDNSLCTWNALCATAPEPSLMRLLNTLVQMYLFLLFMRVLLSWFPSIDWNSNPWTFLRLVRRMNL